MQGRFLILLFLTGRFAFETAALVILERGRSHTLSLFRSSSRRRTGLFSKDLKQKDEIFLEDKQSEQIVAVQKEKKSSKRLDILNDLTKKSNRDLKIKARKLSIVPEKLNRTELIASIEAKTILDYESSIDSCVIPDESFRQTSFERKERFINMLNLVALIAPFIAFVEYDTSVELFHEFIRAGKVWYAVDGGNAEAQLIMPVLNGIVLPAVSIVLGTLVASTLNNLRQRQVIIREW